MTKKLRNAIEEETGRKESKGPLKKKREAHIPTFENPREELRHLVLQHEAITRQKVAIVNQNSDRETKDGQVIPCRIPFDVATEMRDVAENVLEKRATRLGQDMQKCLKHIPIYREFLSKVYGAGPIVCAYLIAYINISKATKPSSLRRFCGFAVIDGRLERPKAGQTNAYVSKLRTVIFQMMSAMWRNAAKGGKTSKYLTIWTGAKHRLQHSARVEGVKIRTSRGDLAPLKGFSHSTGWHKAADVFLEDLYVVWRTLESLPVWPTYKADKLGYAHGGVPCDGAPRVMTLTEALEVVGDVGATGGVDSSEDDVAAE